MVAEKLVGTAMVRQLLRAGQRVTDEAGDALPQEQSPPRWNPGRASSKAWPPVGRAGEGATGAGAKCRLCSLFVVISVVAVVLVGDQPCIVAEVIFRHFVGVQHTGQQLVAAVCRNTDVDLVPPGAAGRLTQGT